ncbi:MAG: response regulator transcription factor [Crocinitomicaceae bacterium]|nr:response regulator transcription factor [Crocinitomicaceae bacterium]
MACLLIVDDHPIFRKGLVGLIADSFPDCSIVEAVDGSQAITQQKMMDFDAVILDIDMPEKSGIDVLDFILENEIKTKPIILTMHNDELFFNEAFDRGAKGFVLKEDSSLEIIECLENIKSNVPFVSKKLKPFLNNRRNFSQQLGAIKDALSSLTKAELNTLKLVSENKSSKEIAELLFVTEKSVENYRSRICKKLNISGGSNTLYKWTIANKELIR